MRIKGCELGNFTGISTGKSSKEVMGGSEDSLSMRDSDGDDRADSDLSDASGDAAVRKKGRSEDYLTLADRKIAALHLGTATLDKHAEVVGVALG